MGEVNQSNVHLFLPWKVAGLAALWAADLGVSRLKYPSGPISSASAGKEKRMQVALDWRKKHLV